MTRLRVRSVPETLLADVSTDGLPLEVDVINALVGPV